MKYEFKGTPGEWSQAHRRDKKGMYSTEVYDSNGDTIATMTWFAKPKDGKGVIGTYRSENAALISAAPDLLKALLLVLPHAECIINENHLAYKKAYAAIHKALNITE